MSGAVKTVGEITAVIAEMLECSPPNVQFVEAIWNK